MKKNLFMLLSLLSFAMVWMSSCSDKEEIAFIEKNVDFAVAQTQMMLDSVGQPTGKNYPRTLNAEGKLVTTGMYDWTPGFFPGSLWYLYELTGDSLWKSNAEKWTASLEPLKTFTGHHDLGFMMYCSYGNGYRLTDNPAYKDILIESAKSLSTRFSEKTGTIKSWNYRKAWNDSVEWFYPVIIDNMINLEMLTAASGLSGDSSFLQIAKKHADKTLKNHFREDFSTYHVVNYDTITGAVRNQATCQGYSDNSTWARGQAWAIYGYTMMYRETKNMEYLNAAINATDFYLNNLPEDLIPVWDFNVGEEGYNPEVRSYAVEFKEKLKDVSAAAVVCSALFELGQYVSEKEYGQLAVKMLHSLSSPQYRAEPGAECGFLLKHSVGSIPHKTEIDVPLVYADYYYLEALVRYKRLLTK
ncbi:glycoside hydrolase family 88 protein [Dysgonomonas sp. 511]|uniref:glycoside hydrolase family 88 protein n=1 Tax=Dysgonomonas sp. 511 TaxID=2302930 RepID=UPI0013D21E9B|nr:glycoside hydrolase family 88 protein [Dysgonomonas sp. 511]NDV78167.1 glycosyl hydrolase family 88 [Dysgonomonas sp. 511]